MKGNAFCDGGQGVPSRRSRQCHSERPAYVLTKGGYKNLEDAVKLLVKFNLVFVALFAVVIVVTGCISWGLMQRNAKQEVYESAKLMIDSALAVRSYTNERIAPLLETQIKYEFRPEMVSAFSALQVIERLKRQNADYKEYEYREPTLNPTNLKDKPADWERDIIGAFRAGAVQPPIFGERDTPIGRVLYMSKPLTAKAPCLQCHRTPANAPVTMIQMYGSKNGFGWKHRILQCPDMTKSGRWLILCRGCAGASWRR